ncbi:MAG: hypothetical protein AAF631_05285 [Pseudomonadota bacterium]
MSQDWIINVLRDLRSFAARNDLAALADQLDDTIHVAVADMTAKTARQAAAAGNDARQHSGISRTGGSV